MGFSIKGYVLEPPRVGQANSPFTFTPNDFKQSSGAFDAYFTPGAEGVSRVDYMAVVQTEGLLPLARFGWTKNDGGSIASAQVRRFDYDAQAGSFRPLPGAAPEIVGQLGADSNTTRLKVVAPIGVLAAAPFRLSVGAGSGLPFLVALVATDGAFGSPPAGTAELSLATGNLNWAAADLVTYAGQAVRWQRQSFFAFTASSGNLGVASQDLLLNPIPGSGQYPRVRFGFGFHLTPVEVADEASFSADPLSGTVEWALTTGRLKFNAADLATYAGKPVYYDGVFFAWMAALPTTAGGTVTAPLPLLPLPEEGGDIVFRLASGYQFPAVRRVTVFDAGTAGEVQLRDDGAVQFSSADQATYGGAPVTVTVADLPLEHGVALRLFRSPVNLDGQDPTVKDVSAVFTTMGAVWASPIVQVPFVFLPATPVEDPGYPLTVYVEQGTGSFTGILPDLNVPAPPVGLGYVLDYEARQLYYAQRKANQLVTFAQEGAAITLPDVAVREEQLAVSLESAPGTGIFTPLVFGTTALFDRSAGLVTLTSPHGALLASGTGGVVGSVLTDASQDFVTLGVLPGHALVVSSGPAAGVYTVTVVAPTQLGLDVAAPADGTAPYEVRTQGEVLADRYFVETTPLDPNTKVERVRLLGVIQNSQIAYVGLAPGQFTTAFTLEDTTADFLAAGVQPGDTVVLTSGPDSGSHRTITVVETTTLTVDRAFTSFPTETYNVERRLHVPRGLLDRTRVRLGLSFVVPAQVATNAAFTAPAILPPGQVEVSLETGDLNFSQADVLAGGQVYWGLTLRFPGDFRVSKDLGFIELLERLLTDDEVYVTYRPITSSGVQPSVTEHVGFLIRKELTQPWPRPAITNLVVFNPAGRTVAAVPAPAVFRGGRPQDTSQVQVNLGASSILFQPNTGFMTNALPSGSAVEPDERVLVDYYVYEAVGGERSFNVLQPPIYAAQVILQGGSPSFALVGDQTALFPAGYLLRVDLQQVYLIGSAVYDGVADLTTITLAYNTVFQDDFTNPKLYVSSGAIPLTPVFPQPSYFVTEMSPFGTVPRGMNTFSLPGDWSTTYATGTVVLFTDNATYYDLYLVSGATFKDGKTQVILQQNVRRQYGAGTVLKRSVRPILEDGVKQATTRDIPLVGQGYTAYRRIEGQPGVVLTSPADYTLDESGIFRYAEPLQPNESLVLFYTSYRTVSAGTRLLASYTTLVTPGSQNGLDGQILKADYSIFSGDSFYYRVETLTNFAGEVLQDLQDAATSGSPSGGPITSNAASPALFDQGRESLFFTEGHTANADYVARRYLKFYNDAVNHLEDILQDADGRVVGDVNGRFRFDGLTTNPPRTTYAQVTNEIDDVFKISEFPVVITSLVPLVTVSVGTYQPLYQASAFSRFYPTSKAHLSAVTTNGTPTAQNGEPIGDLGQKSLTTLPGTAYRRLPRAYVTTAASAGATTLTVDNASGTPTFLRPPFAAGMAVVITDQDGSVLVSDAAPLTVAAVLTAPERLQFASLPVDIPAGATVSLCVTGATPDTVYAKNYRVGFDVGVDLNEGRLIYITPYPPFDGSVPAVPAPLQVQPPAPGEVLELDGVGILQLATAPFRVPALDGSVASDCGDQSIPVLSPTQQQEEAANQHETAAITAVLATTTAPVVLAGVVLNGAGTILTYTGPWPLPVPQLYDLVRFETGLNAGSGYRRIVAVGANTVTVDTAFPFGGAAGDAVITVGTVATGTATFPSATVLDDPLLSVAIEPGYTIIVTSGGNIGVRRQVVARLSATQLQLDAALPSLVGGTYRVSNHLRTYSGWGTTIGAASRQAEVTVTNDSDLNPLVVDSVFLAVDRFLEGFGGADGVLTDLLTPPSNAGTVAGAVLTDPGQDFVAAGVNATHFVFIQLGANAAFYPIQSVDSATQITVGLPFVLPGAVSYRVVKAFGVGFKALEDLFLLQTEADAWGLESQIWAAGLAASAVVVQTPADPSVYANDLDVADLVARQVALAARYAVVTGGSLGTAALVEAILDTRDKLYDKRYAWIDARINVQTGSLYVIQRAVADRVAATAKLYNDLLKILSVQGT